MLSGVHFAKGETAVDMHFQLMQELVDCLSGLPVHLVADTLEGMYEMLETVFQEVVLPMEAVEAFLRHFRSGESGTLCELTSSLPLCYALYHDAASHQYLVLGPYRHAGAAERISDAAFPPSMPADKRKYLHTYCMQQPVVPYEKLHRVAVLFIRYLFKQTNPIPFKRMGFQWGDSFISEVFAAVPFDEVDQIRSVERRYEASAALTEAVKQGNLSLAYRYIQKMNRYADTFVRSPDALRNAKNLCIVLNTQLRHAMEESGVHPYRLDRLSGAIGVEIEQHRTLAEVNNYWREIIRRYCELAQNQDERSLSSLVRMAVTYIKSHLSDNLTVKDTAAGLLVHPDYLSSRFHQEMGVSFITYVNRERVRQAAALLERTEMTVQQIASDVGYNNTSYFARQFAREMGLSPRAYRERSRGRG